MCLVSNGNPPCTPGTCAAILWRCCQLYLKNCWMTQGIFFTPTFDWTFNFLFNVVNFHSDALIFHLLFLRIILTHSFAICYFWAHHSSRPPLPPHSVAHIKELILCDILFGNPENIFPNNSPNCAHLLYLAPTPTNNAVEGIHCSSDYQLLSCHPTSTTNTVHPQELDHHIPHCTPPSSQLGIIHKTSTLENLVACGGEFHLCVTCVSIYHNAVGAYHPIWQCLV